MWTNGVGLQNRASTGPNCDYTGSNPVALAEGQLVFSAVLYCRKMVEIGEVAERFKALVLKISDPARDP